MCQLLETIKLEDGVLFNLEYHNKRFNQARQNFLGISGELKLENLIQIPDKFKKGLFRCRLVYSKDIEKIEFIPHQPKAIKNLKVVIDNDIDYQYKFTNRERLNQLYAMRENCDEIIIIKNGLVTDCSIGNLIFFDGKKWWTPSSPLLKGTRRMQLLNDKIIFEKRIAVNDISSFQKIGIINVFYGIENMSKIPVSSIKF